MTLFNKRVIALREAIKKDRLESIIERTRKGGAEIIKY